MKYLYILAVIASSILSVLYASGGWVVNFGTTASEIGFYNRNINPNIEGPAFGPMSFRVSAGKLWLADSVNGRILCFDTSNNLQLSVALQRITPETLIEDFALPKTDQDPPYIWIAEGAERTIRKISIPEGAESQVIGGHGSEPGKFIQIQTIETDSAGNLYVGDIGKSVISIFSPDGELIREIKYQNCGFSIDENDRLSLLRYSESSGYFWEKYTSQGTLESSTHIGCNDFHNPKILFADKTHLHVSFVPPEGYKGHLELLNFDSFGCTISKTVFQPPSSMNRFLVQDSNILWLAEADFTKAPAGKFSVKPLSPGESK